MLLPATFLLLCSAVGMAANEDTPVLIGEVEGDELPQCKGGLLHNCKRVGVDFGVLYGKASTVLIMGEAYEREFQDGEDHYRVFMKDSGHVAMITDSLEHGFREVQATLTSGPTDKRIVLGCGPDCHYIADMHQMPASARLAESSNRAACTQGDRLGFYACALIRVANGCTIDFNVHQCEATCGNNCCGDSNFLNCAALKAITFNWGCDIFGGNIFCRRTCNQCTV